MDSRSSVDRLQKTVQACVLLVLSGTPAWLCWWPPPAFLENSLFLPQDLKESFLLSDSPYAETLPNPKGTKPDAEVGQTTLTLQETTYPGL